MKLTPSAKFELLWKSLGGWGLVKEYKFVDGRRFRFDYYHMNKVAIELEGGLGLGASREQGGGQQRPGLNTKESHRGSTTTRNDGDGGAHGHSTVHHAVA